MLTVYFKNGDSEIVPDVHRVRVVDDKLLCLSKGNSVVRAFTRTELMAYTRNVDLATRLNEALRLQMGSVMNATSLGGSDG
jgi:hypothetical protein